MRVRRGFTLTELLVVIAIIALLAVVLFNSLINQRNAADDAKSKADLSRLKIAFEDYYNDHNCYPPAAWFDSVDDCGSSNLKPYLNEIPCDKNTGLPYALEKDATTCNWFKLYATLKSPDRDAQVLAMCDEYNGSMLGNYGVSSTNTDVKIVCHPKLFSPIPSITPTPSPIITPTPSPSPTPTPTPTPTPEGSYYCPSIGHCQFYNNVNWTCTPNYSSSNCDGACAYSTGACIHD